MPILLSNVPKMESFQPKFCIFERQFFDKKVFFDNLPTVKNFG